MSTDNPWALVGAGDNETAIATAADSFPATYPDRPARGAGSVLPLVAGGILIAGGVAMIGVLFSHFGTLPIEYDFPNGDVYYGLRALCLLATGLLLLNRRTREFGSGAAMGIAVTWLAFHFAVFAPTALFPHEGRGSQWLYLASLVAALVSALLILLSVLKTRTGVASDNPRAMRLAVVLTGTVATAALFAGMTMNWVRDTVSIADPADGLSLPPRTSDCCAFALQSSTNKAQLIIGGVAIFALVLIALVTRSRKLAAGLVIGAALVPLSDIAQVVVQVAAPIQSLQGISASNAIPDLNVTTAPLIGYWISVAGLLLLVLAAVLRIVVGSRRQQPYTAHPFTEQT